MLDPVEEQTRRAFVAFRHAHGWSRLRTSIELGCARSTIEAWEHASPEKHQRIPAAPFEVMRRLAAELGYDSLGKLKAVSA